jgi:hypothetical protein
MHSEQNFAKNILKTMTSEKDNVKVLCDLQCCVLDHIVVDT